MNRTPPPLTNRVIGLQIRQNRRRQKMTQADLGRQVGLSADQIQNYESGKDSATIHQLHRIALALGTSFEQLIQR